MLEASWIKMALYQVLSHTRINLMVIEVEILKAKFFEKSPYPTEGELFASNLENPADTDVG